MHIATATATTKNRDGIKTKQRRRLPNLKTNQYAVNIYIREKMNGEPEDVDVNVKERATSHFIHVKNMYGMFCTLFNRALPVRDKEYVF